MKYLLFGDIHGRDLKDIQKVIEEEKPDQIVCLGDFDTPACIEQWLEIRKNYKTITVPGNHDLAFLYNDEITSGIWTNYIDMKFEDLKKELVDNRNAWEYLESLAKNTIWTGEIAGRKALVIHGGLAGSLESYPECPKELRPLWYRLLGTEGELENLWSNFKKLEERGYELMIRGHDHVSAFFKKEGNVISWKRAKEKEEETELPGADASVIISVGSYFFGDFVLLEGDRVKFRKIDPDYRCFIYL
ncbi:MAG: hypothetical protein DRP12_01410 [Candidatus Aenigmatarchaeota archaeon]|nr:MAG: hypothetical protein DRP12_01410 [Candidatus Aenigmarchaeota archaeon]